MRDFFLQIQSQDSVQSSLSENMSSFVLGVFSGTIPNYIFQIVKKLAKIKGLDFTD